MKSRLHQGISLALRSLAMAGSILLLTSAAPATAQNTVLGADGELFTLRLGKAGELLKKTNGDADAPILALEITAEDGTSSRLVVPGSEDEDQELSASLVFEPVSNSVYMIWASQYNFAHTRIRLIQYSDGDWSEPIEITDDPFNFKTAPMIAVTREAFTAPGTDGGLVPHERTILHTLWFEEAWEGDAVLYSPLILVDGVFVDRQSIVRLADLSNAPLEDSSEPVQRGLLVSPAINAGDTDHKVVATVLDAATNQLLNFEIEAMALEITQLADDVKDAFDPKASCREGGLVTLGKDARANIVTIARNRGFRGSMAASLASEAYSSIVSLDESVCNGARTGISDEVAETVIGAGADLSGGLFTLESDARANIVTIARKRGLDHRLMIRGTAARTAPQTSGTAKVLVSRDGQSNIVAWETKDGTVHYVESTDDGWSAALELQLDGDLQAADTLQVLSSRLDG